MSERWKRRAGAVVIDHRDALTLVGKGGEARRFEGASADVVRAALRFWSSPRTEEELVEHLGELAGEPCDPTLVADVARHLAEASAIEAAPETVPAAKPRDERARAKVLVGVSGAIAAMDAPVLVRLLQARRFDVTVALTKAARRFVSVEALEALTHRPVYRSFWQKHERGPAPHIHLATWPDLVVVYPASAATVARIAHATCDDVLSAAITATSAPVLVVPSMNERMLGSPGVQRNLELLREDGRHVLGASLGLEVAFPPSERTPLLGAAPPPLEVVTAIEVLLRDRPAAPARCAPASAEVWDREYAAGHGDLPWFTESLDSDLAEELASLPRGRLADLGTGPGTAAIFAAQRGFEVVATDISASALAIARRRAEGLPVTWVLDDVTASRLWGDFDVLVDRGCFHCLPRAAWSAYAKAALRLLRPGGLLLLKTHAPEVGGRYGTTAPRPDELVALFAGLSVARTRPSTFDGTLDPAPPAILTVLVRQ